MDKLVLCGFISFFVITLTACSSARETKPEKTAHEQLMLSSAADFASQQIKPKLPKGSAIYLNSTLFDNDSKYQTNYALSRIRAQLLAEGFRLVDSPKKADTIAEVSHGALSIDESDFLIGLRSLNLPIPFTDSFDTPEMPLYKKKEKTGVAKFSIVFYNAKTGEAQHLPDPVFGFSHSSDSSIIAATWSEQDILPKEEVKRSQTIQENEKAKK